MIQIELEFEADDTTNQVLQNNLNKTTKFSRKHGVGNLAFETGNAPSSGMDKYEGLNYTVSINFNRPQQSKGKYFSHFQEKD
jgi:hypothetical protein